MDNIKNDPYYGSVDLTIVYDTLKNDIPELLELMEQEM